MMDNFLLGILFFSIGVILAIVENYLYVSEVLSKRTALVLKAALTIAFLTAIANQL